MMKKLLLSLCVVSFTFALFSQAPNNDTIETATEITSFPFMESNLRLDLAAANPGGQTGCNLEVFNSVYYKFQATESNFINLEIFNNFDESIDVVNNNFIIVFDAPNLNATNNDLSVVTACSGGARRGFRTQSGQSYYILIYRSVANALTTFSASEQQDVPEYERIVLFDLYNATNGFNWSNNTNWNSNGPVSSFFGVNTAFIDGEEHIVGINLNSNNLNGTIPNSITTLEFLSVLNLEENQLNGIIPETIGDLSNLTDLILSSNNLSGFIPPSIGNLSNLNFLVLQNNNLSGGIPSELGNLNSLIWLILSNNPLGGIIPENIGNLNNLEILSLINNNLFGNIPQELGNLSNLSVLWLSSNFLNGNIPNTLGNLNSLNNLRLSFNNLEGNLPNSIANLGNLQLVYLNNNNLNGSIPDLSANPLQQLLIQGNKYEFGDFENEFPTYQTNITIFQYTPQKSLDPKPNIVANIGEEISINADVSGVANVYEWYKRNSDNTSTLISNDQILSFVLDETKVGNYYLSVTNTIIPDLTLQTPDFSISLEPSPDFDTLVDFYNATNGDNWAINTNWNNPNVPISNWHGLTVSNNRVVAIDLNFNQLSGNIPNSILSLTELQNLILSQNSISGEIPDFSLLPNINFVAIDRNNFDFQDLEANFTNNNTSLFFSYSPQNLRDEPISLNAQIGEDYNFNMTPINGTNIQYQWFRVSSFDAPDIIVPGANTNILNIFNAQEADIDQYSCFATSPIIQDLVIKREFIELKGEVSQIERDALISMYNATDGDNWTNNFNWLSAQPVSTWAGVTTTGNRVTFLDLAARNLNGQLPSEFGNLSKLEAVRITLNPNLTGNIPSEIGNLDRLTTLNMSFNGLEGIIPTSIGNLSSLVFLFLDNNQLSGAIPTSLGSLERLQFLYLNNNNLEGEIPTFINPAFVQIQNNVFNFGNLEPFVLSNNYLNLLYSPQRTNDIEENIDSGVGADIILDVNDTNLNRDIEDTAVNNEYQWFKDGTPITGANANTYTIFNAQETDSGVYFCQITNDLLPDLIINRANITLNIDSTLTIENLDGNEFSMYPNPVSNWLTIKTNSNLASKVTIVDLNGKQLLEKDIHTNITSLNVEQLPTGVYLITITNDGSKTTKRFIKN